MSTMSVLRSVCCFVSSVRLACSALVSAGLKMLVNRIWPDTPGFCARGVHASGKRGSGRAYLTPLPLVCAGLINIQWQAAPRQIYVF